MPIQFLPASVQPTARRIREWALTDAPALVILGVGLILRGVSYLPTVVGDSPSSHPAEEFFHIQVWGVIWIAVGIACLAATAWHRAAPAAIGAGVGLHAIWAMSFIADSIADHSPRGWLPAVGYASVALLVIWAVWRGSREIIPEGAVANELRRE